MIGEHVEILSGYAFNSKEFNTNEEGIPLVRIRDVGKIRSKTYYTGKYSNKYILENGDFLIGMDGDFRLAIWNGGKALLNQRVCKITPNESVFNSGYMYYMLPKELKRIEDTTSFATVKHLSVKKIKDIKIPLPPLDQQKKIATILDAADAYRQKTKALIEKYDELTQSLFLDMFGDPVRNPMGWNKVELMTLCDKITDGTHKTPKYQDSGVVFLSAKNIKNFQLNYLDCKYISEIEHIALSKRCPVEIGDLLLTKSGSLGMAAMVEFDFEFSIFESLALVKYNRDLINGKFLLFYLNTPSTQFQYHAMTKGVGVKHLHLTDLRKLSVIVPPKDLQEEFMGKIKAIEAQKAQAQASLAGAEDLFNSLLQRAFKGELTD